MKIIQLSQISTEDKNRIMRRSFGMDTSVKETVQRIMDDVRTGGDTQLLAYERKFGCTSPDNSLRVTPGEIARAYQELPAAVITALKQMKRHITAVHSAQLKKKKDTVVSPVPGITVWREWRPIDRVGLYVPGGRATYPSSVLMTAIPAKIAGCPQVVICSPPAADGLLAAPILVAADLAGVTEIYKTGGAQAIAAMAYGTASIPQVYKIFGAGNAYVTMAKMLAYPTVAIDMPAGPSEVFIIADETADPRFIAADLLTDGEHGNDSACVLVTTSRSLAEETLNEIKKQLQHLPTRDRVIQSFASYGLIALVDTIKEAIDFANEYAPEHLQIMTATPMAVARSIRNAGSVFLGSYTGKASGDYATGANHVLPTGGMAKMYPPLGVDAFGKWMQIQQCTKQGLQTIRTTLETIAEAEHLPAHIESTRIRFERKSYD